MDSTAQHESSSSRSPPSEVLRQLARDNGLDVMSQDFARFMDSKDPLAEFRQRYAYPRKGRMVGVEAALVQPDEECVYLCGNSLGLKPRTADARMQALLDSWSDNAVEMHFTEPLPAALCDLHGREEMGELVGADPAHVVLMNGLTVNLHLLLLSFYQPSATRYKILIEAHAFPSDRYAMVSQAELRGFDPKEAVVEVKPRPGEDTLRTEDILKVLSEEGPSIAVVCMSGVQYYTGQKFDMERITQAAQAQGCLVGWDLAHAVGNVRLCLDRWGVDFACWCTYKYLCSGAGGIAAAYVNPRHQRRAAPFLRGWWSNNTDTRFEMREQCDVAEGVMAYRLCNPPPFLVTLVLANLENYKEAGMDRLLHKQFLLTGYLELLLTAHFCPAQGSAEAANGMEAPTVNIITPSEVGKRGSQLSLVFSVSLHRVHQQLKKRGVVCDIRLPNVMRVSPVPMYNSFEDVFKFITILQEVFAISKEEAT